MRRWKPCKRIIMNKYGKYFRVFILAPLVMLAITLSASAHEGHTHAEPAAAPALDPLTNRISVSGAGELFEATIVFSNSAEEGEVPLRVLVAEKASNAPVSDATVELTLAGGPQDLTLRPTPAGEPGVYLTTAPLASGVAYSVLVDITRGEASDFFSVDNLRKVTPTNPVAAHDPATDYRQWFNYALIAGAFFVIGFLAGLGSKAAPTVRRKRK
jgi:hypothetical protein